MIMTDTPSIPLKFTNPFRYFPHPLAVMAAREVMERIDSSDELRPAFSEGKMLGVLLYAAESPHAISEDSPHVIPKNSPHVIPKNSSHVIPKNSPHVIPGCHSHVIPGCHSHVIPGLTRNLVANTPIYYLAAFSGSVGGHNLIEGFVPPIYDLLNPSGYFKQKEAEISAINQVLESATFTDPLANLKKELAKSEIARDKEIERMKAQMAISKRLRDEARSELSDSSRLDALIRESQFEKAELKRLKDSWEVRIEPLRFAIDGIESSIRKLKAERSKMSDELQEWIFRQYTVHNHLGEESTVWDIFSNQNMTPPGGTGDCAAPKLLEYAFRNGLRPLAMGEFWYGKPSGTAVREHGHFYPSCTSKCGPLLGWMMKGLDIADDLCGAGLNSADESLYRTDTDLLIIHEDEALIAVDKPSGMPSVPGLDGRESAYEILAESYGELHAVHRLDMDTSGILLFAKTAEAAVVMQKQFERQTIEKTYRARLCAGGTLLRAGDKGRIELKLGPDYDERPRQKVDCAQGKAAVTDYEVISVNEDGTADILFHPLTGRTHQLRVHAAHPLGLGRPILGDPLYGSASVFSQVSGLPRLHLHAASMAFRHPISGEAITLHCNL